MILKRGRVMWLSVILKRGRVMWLSVILKHGRVMWLSSHVAVCVIGL